MAYTALLWVITGSNFRKNWTISYQVFSDQMNNGPVSHLMGISQRMPLESCMHKGMEY
jgi:hypothetical protein